MSSKVVKMPVTKQKKNSKPAVPAKAPTALQKPARQARQASLGNGNAKTHGHYSRKEAPMRLGWECFTDTLDRRTTTGRTYFEKRERIYSDLGGRKNIAELKLGRIDHVMALDALARMIGTSYDMWS